MGHGFNIILCLFSLPSCSMSNVWPHPATMLLYWKRHRTKRLPEEASEKDSGATGNSFVPWKSELIVDT